MRLKDLGYTLKSTDSFSGGVVVVTFINGYRYLPLDSINLYNDGTVFLSDELLLTKDLHTAINNEMKSRGWW